MLDKYPNIEIPLVFEPHFLSVSGGESSVLVVCGQHQQRLLIACFDLSDLGAVNGSTVPFSYIQLDSKQSEDGRVLSLEWHPEFNESLFLAVLSNGTMISVGVNLRAKSAQLLTSLRYNEQITCVSWSPKGKQFVIGKENGHLIQLKHKNGKDFEEAKVINPPAEFAGFSLHSMRWCFTSLFAAAYVRIQGNDLQTKFVTVHAPPKVHPTFNDHGAVCMDFYTKGHLYWANFLHFENLIITSTSCSSEFGLLGCDNTKDALNGWKQLILDDTARVELPLDKDNKETYPRGIALYLHDTTPLKISESEIYGGKNCPLMLVLNSSGILCPYYVVYPKLQLPVQLPSKQLEFTIQPNAQQTLPTPAAQPPMKAVQPPAVNPSQSVTKQTVPQPAAMQEPTSQPQETFKGNTPNSPSLTPLAQTTAFTYTRPVQKSSEVIAANAAKQAKDEQNAFVIAIKDESEIFNKQMKHIKVKTERMRKISVGTDEEKKFLVSKLAEWEKMLEHCYSRLDGFDLNLLEAMLLENFSLAEEAKSRFDRDKDPKYSLLLQRKPLDVITARKVKEIQAKSVYIDTQLRELNRVLDQEWREYMVSDRTRVRHSDTPLQLVYTTLSNNHKVIRSLEQQLKQLEVNVPSHSKLANLAQFQNRRSEIGKLSELINHCRLQDAQPCETVTNDVAENGLLFGKKVLVKQMPPKTRETLRKHLEQATSVRMIRSSLPTDLDSSLIVSAIAKAQEKLKNMGPEKDHRVISKVNATRHAMMGPEKGKPALRLAGQSAQLPLNKPTVSNKSVTFTAQPAFAAPSPVQMTKPSVPTMNQGKTAGISASQQQRQPEQLLQSAPLPFGAIPPNFAFPGISAFNANPALLNQNLINPLALLPNNFSLNTLSALAALDPNTAAAFAAVVSASPGLIPNIPVAPAASKPAAAKTKQKLVQKVEPKLGASKESITKPNYEDISPPDTPARPVPKADTQQPPYIPVQSTPVKLDTKIPKNFSFDTLGQFGKSVPNIFTSSTCTTVNTPVTSILSTVNTFSFSSFPATTSATQTPFGIASILSKASTSAATTAPSASLSAAATSTAVQSTSSTVNTSSISAPVTSPFSFSLSQSNSIFPTTPTTAAVTSAVISDKSGESTTAFATLTMNEKAATPTTSATTVAATTTASETQANFSFSLGCLEGSPNPENLNKNPFGGNKPMSTSLFGSNSTSTSTPFSATTTTASIASPMPSTTAASTGALTTTAAATTTTSNLLNQSFGQSSIFGNNDSSQKAPIPAFGQQTSAFATNSIFGSSSAPVFAATGTTTSSSVAVSPFSKQVTGSLFGAAVTVSSPFAAQTSAVSTQSAVPVFGRTSSFGTAPTAPVSVAGFSTLSGSTSSAGPFSSSSSGFGSAFARPAQSGSLFGGAFSSPSTASNQPISSSNTAPLAGQAFGASPAFGSPPAFGAPPAFGSPAFGNTATFGSPSAFGSSPTFGGATAGFGSVVSSTATGTSTFGGVPGGNSGFSR